MSWWIYVPGVVLVVLVLGLLSGCANKVLNTGADIAALDQAVADAGKVIENRLDELPPEDAAKVKEAWTQIKRAHSAIKGVDADALAEYKRARFAYLDLRKVTEKHWEKLTPYQQERALEIDKRAVRLHERFMAEQDKGVKSLAGYVREALLIASRVVPVVARAVE